MESNKQYVQLIEFKHLILGLALSELAFHVFYSRSLHGVLIGILRCLYLLFEHCSINSNFACRLNKNSGFLKCKSTGIDFKLLTSFLWFSLMLKLF